MIFACFMVASMSGSAFSSHLLTANSKWVSDAALPPLMPVPMKAKSCTEEMLQLAGTMSVVHTGCLHKL